MTVNKLLKLLQAAVADGHGRCPVCIDKPTFTHPLEPDGACILDISGLRSESVPMMNDDGGTGHGPHGSERYRFSIVLHGASYSSRGEGRATDPEWGDNQTRNQPDGLADDRCKQCGKRCPNATCPACQEANARAVNVEPAPGVEAFTPDGRFISGTGYEGERR